MHESTTLRTDVKSVQRIRDNTGWELRVRYSQSLFSGRALFSTMTRWQIANAYADIVTEAWLMRLKGRVGKWRIYGYLAPAPTYAEDIIRGVDRVIAEQSQRPSRINIWLSKSRLSLVAHLHKPDSSPNLQLIELLEDFVTIDVPKIVRKQDESSDQLD